MISKRPLVGQKKVEMGWVDEAKRGEARQAVGRMDVCLKERDREGRRSCS